MSTIDAFVMTEKGRDFLIRALVEEVVERGHFEDDIERAIEIAQKLKLCDREEFFQFLEQGADTLEEARRFMKKAKQ